MKTNFGLPIITAALVVMLVTQVTGHSGATGVVKARMDSMAQIKEGMKALGTMATGKMAFDPAQAIAAAGLIEEHANRITALFQEKDVSAPSEARNAIWTNWDDFVTQAETLAKAANKAKSKSVTLSGLRASVPELGATCKSCHKDYRL